MVGAASSRHRNHDRQRTSTRVAETRNRSAARRRRQEPGISLADSVGSGSQRAEAGRAGRAATSTSRGPPPDSPHKLAVSAGIPRVPDWFATTRRPPSTPSPFHVPENRTRLHPSRSGYRRVRAALLCRRGARPTPRTVSLQQAPRQADGCNTRRYGVPGGSWKGPPDMLRADRRWSGRRTGAGSDGQRVLDVSICVVHKEQRVHSSHPDEPWPNPDPHADARAPLCLQPNLWSCAPQHVPS